MIVYKDNKGFESREDKPSENWTDADVFVVEDGSELAQKIMANYPYYNFVTDQDGELIDITPTERPPEPQEPPSTEERLQAVEETLTALLGL
ncbi:hypothetical protein D0469_07005 [Peribacillus saganii]|uniref:Uncharacterized protein n=1 Tax=Peribacillus saganii TaxID=2303992 RepID=A0A372LRD3_9BACI|nr:hypothetical protein [Peribacillus saganii]RFU70342.1 hypothetical protein D0469_07005 [Peribacillus saganii]